MHCAVGMRVGHVVEDIVEEASCKERPLDGETSKEEVKSDRAPAISLQESHQEAETDDDHHMRILEPLSKSSYLQVALTLVASRKPWRWS